MRAFQGGIVAAILLLPLFALAYKSPGQPSGFVNDFAKVLTTDQVLELNKELAAFSLQGEQDEISVVTIPTLGGDDIESYAAALFAEWGIGKADKDNGVLLLIAVEDRKMRIEVGYGAEALLTDAQSGVIIRTILTPAFRANDFYGGISHAVQEITKALSGDTTDLQNLGASETGQVDDHIFPNLFIVGWFVLGLLRGIAVALGKSKSWWAGGLIGGMFGLALSLYFGFLYIGLLAIIGLGLLGLVFDFLVSRVYERNMHLYNKLPWWLSGGGRGGSGGSGGGFGGFGGGSSGGGGASGGW